jgi:hypothetical protein
MIQNVDVKVCLSRRNSLGNLNFVSITIVDRPGTGREFLRKSSALLWDLVSGIFYAVI